MLQIFFANRANIVYTALRFFKLGLFYFLCEFKFFKMCIYNIFKDMKKIKKNIQKQTNKIQRRKMKLYEATWPAH